MNFPKCINAKIFVSGEYSEHKICSVVGGKLEQKLLLCKYLLSIYENFDEKLAKSWNVKIFCPRSGREWCQSTGLVGGNNNNLLPSMWDADFPRKFGKTVNNV